MNRRKIFVIILLSVLAFIFYGCTDKKSEYPVVDDRIVAHAMGQVDENARTNSLEAFKNSYAKGTRVFEVDFFNTADHRIVAVHDWGEWFDWIGENIDDYSYRAYSHTDYMNTKIAHKYTPLDLESVAQLMIDYPDIYIVTDTKRMSEKLYRDDISRIFIALEMKQEGLSDRLIVQAYNENNIIIAQELLPDTNIIFTAYMSGLSDEKIAELCSAYPHLYAITVEKSKITDTIIQAAQDAGLKVYVHTVNSDENYSAYFSKGVYGVYTDDLTVADIDN